MKIVIVFLTVISIASLWIYLNPADSTTMARVKNLGEPDSTNHKGTKMENKIVKTDEEWKKELSPKSTEFFVRKELSALSLENIGIIMNWELISAQLVVLGFLNLIQSLIPAAAGQVILNR